MERIYEQFFSPENWDPYANFKYRTNSVKFKVAEISTKQNETFMMGWCDRIKFSYFEPVHILQDNQNKK